MGAHVGAVSSSSHLGQFHLNMAVRRVAELAFHQVLFTLRTTVWNLITKPEAQSDCVAMGQLFAHSSLVSIEPTVRAELMEQVPHIALFCQENRPSIPYAFSKYLLPIVVRYLADQNNQVRLLCTCS